MSRPHMELREWCTLVNEECNWNHCEGCPNNVPRLTKQEEAAIECEFVHETVLNHILPVMVNRANTIAKADLSNNISIFIKYYGLKKTGYSPDNLKPYSLFFMLKMTHKLGIPREIYTAKNKTCVAVYDDFAYIIAPKRYDI